MIEHRYLSVCKQCVDATHAVRLLRRGELREICRGNRDDGVS